MSTGGVHQITAVAMQYPLGFTRGAGCVEDKQWILGIHFLHRTIG